MDAHVPEPRGMTKASTLADEGEKSTSATSVLHTTGGDGPSDDLRMRSRRLDNRFPFASPRLPFLDLAPLGTPHAWASSNQVEHRAERIAADTMSQIERTFGIPEIDATEYDEIRIQCTIRCFVRIIKTGPGRVMGEVYRKVGTRSQHGASKMKDSGIRCASKPREVDNFILAGALYCKTLVPNVEWYEVVADLDAMGIMDTVSPDDSISAAARWLYVRGRWNGRLYEGGIEGAVDGVMRSDKIALYLRDRGICSD